MMHGVVLFYFYSRIYYVNDTEMLFARLVDEKENSERASFVQSNRHQSTTLNSYKCFCRRRRFISDSIINLERTRDPIAHSLSLKLIFFT